MVQIIKRQDDAGGRWYKVRCTVSEIHIDRRRSLRRPGELEPVSMNFGIRGTLTAETAREFAQAMERAAQIADLLEAGKPIRFKCIEE